MKVSARNFLEAQVVEIKQSGLMAQVRVRLMGGEELVSVLTADALQELSLRVGDGVRLAVNAFDVLLTK